MINFFARRVNRKVVLQGVMTIALSICFSTFSMAAPTEARLAKVADCNFLGKIEGWSGYGKNNGWEPLAKASALGRAENMGASHVVWERLIPIGAFNGYAVARTYHCGNT